MTRPGLYQRFHARFHADERGFSLVEALMAGMVLAIGSFAVAQALNYGFQTSGLARQRLAAQGVADEQMEHARSLNYQSLLLGGGAPPSHSTNPSSPDYWVSATDGDYNPTEAACSGGGETCYEPIVWSLNAAPSLQHFQDPVIRGNTKFTIYMYVSWVDSPTDGTGGSDLADGNGDGDDEGTNDQKRVTVVVAWPNIGSVASSLTVTALVSDGQVPYKSSGTGVFNQPPEVDCPATTISGLAVDFDLNGAVSDADGGTITNIDWDFGDGDTTINGGLTESHTYAASGTYTIVNEATDNGGAVSDNSADGCEITVTAPTPSPTPGPGGTIVVQGGAAYTSTTSVTLTLSITSGTATEMQFSNDGSTWGAAQAYSTSALYSLPTGDGAKTVYVRFRDSSGAAGPTASDSIILDIAPPGAPTGLSVNRLSTGPPALRYATLTWTAPSPLDGDLVGYRVYRRAITAPTFTQITCTFSSATTCQDGPGTLVVGTSYEWYVVSYDIAGNESGQSNHVTV